MKKYYKISEENLIKFIAAYYELEALDNGGVGNWEWYSESIRDWFTVAEEDCKQSFSDIAKKDIKMWGEEIE